MRCTSNYPFAKPVDMDIFLHSTHKREKVLIPRLLFILYDQYPYTFPPLLYTATEKTYVLSHRHQQCISRICVISFISVAMRTAVRKQRIKKTI